MTWADYQNKVAEVFSEFGAIASIESKVEGARGVHKIDVYVELEIHGIKSKWICECKLWKKPVGKSSVLTFHSVINDVGADRGFFFSESGFQSGAINVTKNTNITLTSLDEFKSDVKKEIAKYSLLTWLNRISKIRREIKPAWLDDAFNPRFHEMISFDKCVSLDGALLIMAPKIQEAMDDIYPINLPRYSNPNSVKCLNFEDLNFHLKRDFIIIEKDFKEILEALDNLRLKICEDRKHFISSADSLIAYSNKCIYNSPSEDDLSAIAALMKIVGSTSSNLKDSSSGSLRKQLGLTMRFLIDMIYPHFLKETDSLEEWKTSLNEVKKHLNKLEKIDII
jgi:hypothetical protein